MYRGDVNAKIGLYSRYDGCQGIDPFCGIPLRLSHDMPGGLRAATVNGKDIESDEYIDLREKKFKKILTPEQYQRFRTIHPDPTEFFIK